MLVERRQLEHALGQWAQPLRRLGTGGQCSPVRLIGQRDRDLRAGGAREDFDRVALQGREIVEPVEEHRL
jgi:hypothetical protein